MGVPHWLHFHYTCRLVKVKKKKKITLRSFKHRLGLWKGGSCAALCTCTASFVQQNAHTQHRAMDAVELWLLSLSGPALSTHNTTTVTEATESYLKRSG